ncbi:MAG: hypothetical protein CTY28_15600 [Hyphomicrobium sp.]|nr:MAG: hypothetical protein CTY28_15600 [Hyphomicrobium sp.]
MSDTEDHEIQLLPDDQSPERAADRAVKWKRRPNRAYVRTTHDPVKGGSTYVITEAGRDAVRKASAGGMSIAAIARNVLGISRYAFEDMRKRDASVQELVEYGRELLADEITDLLLAQARNGVVASTIFLARSRAGFENDAGVIEGKAQPKVVNNTVNVTFAQPMTKEDFAALLDPKVIDHEH